MIATSIPKTITKTRVLYTFSILAIGALFVVLFLHFRTTRAPLPVVPSGSDAIVSVGGTSIPVTIADSDIERQQGLSNTNNLSDGSGKFFIFDNPGIYGFWMKDMQYGIDIIWVDSDWRIIAIDKDISPETYPAIFYPPSDVLYVLEVGAGFSTQYNLSVNQLLTLHQELVF